MRSSRSYTESEEFMGEAGSSPDVNPLYMVLRLLRLRWPIMVIVTAVTGVLGAVGAWFVSPETYTATARIQFLSMAPRIMYQVDRWGDSAYSSYVSTQVQLMRSDVILERLLDEPEVRDLEVLKSQPDRLLFLRNSIGADVQRGTELVNVTCTLPDRAAAKRILEEVIRVYMQMAQTEEAEAGGERLAILVKERDTRQADLEIQQRAINDLRARQYSSAGTPFADSGEGTVHRETLIRAQDDLSRAQSQVTSLQSQAERIRGLQEENRRSPEKPIVGFTVEDRVSKDPRVVGLETDLARAEVEISTKRNELPEQHWKLDREQARIESLRQSVETMRQTVRKEILAGLPAELDAQIELAQAQVTEAQERVSKYATALDEYSQRLLEGSSQWAKLEEMTKRADDTRVMVDEINKQIAAITLEKQAPARIKLVNPGNPVSVPTSPNRAQAMMLIALALLGSAGLGIGAGVLREVTDRQLRMTEDLVRLTRYPVIATIPHSQDDPWLKGESFPLLVSHYRASKTADQMRRVVTSIVYPADTAVSFSSLLVTSPTRGDGKTSFAANLAYTLAQANRPVLLVDLSYRTPECEAWFGLEPRPGLSEVLHGEASASSLIRPTEYKNLWVLGPGMHLDGLAQRLASREMSEFLKSAEERFTHVIIDSPPVLVMSEASLLAPVVDGIIVVVGARASQAGMVKRCLAELEQSGSNIVGLIMNGARGAGGKGLREELDLYYNYEKKRNGKRNGHNGRTTATPVDIPHPAASSVIHLPHDDLPGRDD